MQSGLFQVKVEGWTELPRAGRAAPRDFPLNLLPLDFHSRGILLTIAIMQEKQQQNIFEIECLSLMGLPRLIYFAMIHL